MFDEGSLIIIPLLSGIEGSDTFNLFFSLVFAGGFISFVPVAIMSFLKRS